jgi:hypothetical protein
MAVSVVAVELCARRPTGGGSAPAVSKSPALTRQLGWLLALVARVVAGAERIWIRRGSLFAVSAIARDDQRGRGGSARVAARSGAGATTARCDGRDRCRAGPQNRPAGWGCGRLLSSSMCRTPCFARGGNASKRGRRSCKPNAPHWPWFWPEPRSRSTPSANTPHWRA